MSTTHTRTSSKTRSATHGFAKRVALGLVVTFLLIGVTSLFAKTGWGRRLTLLTYEFLQTQLPAHSGDGQLPILVVDTGKIPGGKDGPTPRPVLKEMIKAIADQRPKVIGVDIDFSPGGAGWKVDDDPQFLDFCLAVKKDTGVPIFLAVYSARAETADKWLGLDKYKEMAASGEVYFRDITRLPQWIQADGVPDKLPTLSAALATAYAPSLPSPYNWFTQTVEANHPQGIDHSDNYQSFAWRLIDYSKLPQIQSEALATTSARAIAESGSRFTGRMILLGDATHSEDSFIVPGNSDTVAGVNVWASAAYTLAIAPLLELNSRTRLALDLLIAIGLILGVECIRAIYVNKHPGPRFYTAQGWFIGISIFAVFFFGGLMIYWLRIMWFDFPLVMIASLLHPRVEHWFGHLWKTLTRNASAR